MAFTPEQFQQFLETMQRPAAPGQPVAPAPQLTPEQINQMFNVYAPNEQLVADILEGGPKALAAIQSLVAGVVKQATTMSWHQAQFLTDEFGRSISPMQAWVRDQQHAAVKADFYKGYPTLEGRDQLLALLQDRLDQEGKLKGLSTKQAFKVIGDAAIAMGLDKVPVAAPVTPGQPAAPTAPAAAAPIPPVTSPAALAGATPPGGGGPTPAGGTPSAQSPEAIFKEH